MTQSRFRRSTALWKHMAVLALALALAVIPGAAVAQSGNAGAAIAAKGTPGGAAACVACHGAKGEGNGAAGFPRLAGLPADYLAAQLDHFAAERRKNLVMGPVAKQLTAAERKAAAARSSVQ